MFSEMHENFHCSPRAYWDSAMQDGMDLTITIYDSANTQNELVLMILSVLNNERRCTVERIVELTNLGENKIRSAIEFMIESGLIEASGKGKNRTCILGKKIYRENKKAIQYVRQTDIDSIRYPELVMKLANTQNGIITKQDVIELLKVTPSQAYTVIKKLQGEGRLKLLCGGKYSKYKVVNS